MPEAAPRHAAARTAVFHSIERFYNRSAVIPIWATAAQPIMKCRRAYVQKRHDLADHEIGSIPHEGSELRVAWECSAVAERSHAIDHLVVACHLQLHHG